MRPNSACWRLVLDWFQSTHSLRSATIQSCCTGNPAEVSIHALLAECDRAAISDFLVCSVSIHALLAECDSDYRESVRLQNRFNPRTPCGVRPEWGKTRFCRKRFQSTHSLRSATFSHLNKWGWFQGFNPRTPCGVRHNILQVYSPSPQFQSTHSLRSATFLQCRPPPAPPVSIHALLAECDVDNLAGHLADIKFQSTHSLRSATYNPFQPDYRRIVSIHALLAECDPWMPSQAPGKLRFNPRTPCGVRRKASDTAVSFFWFQSTHSLRSATLDGR